MEEKLARAAAAVRETPAGGACQLDVAPAVLTASRYALATDAERERVWMDLRVGQARNLRDYLRRFAAGLRGAGRGLQLVLRPMGNLIGYLGTWSERRVFHAGLVKDENGDFWILKRFAPREVTDRGVREARNLARRERLAYLLSRGIANLSEIRTLRPDEAQALGLRGDPAEYYLSRLVFDRPSTAPQQDLLNDPAEAYAANLVFNIWTRKWDAHLGNQGFHRGVPVLLDHDQIFRFDRFPHTPAGWQRFLTSFTSASAVSTTQLLLDPANFLKAGNSEFQAWLDEFNNTHVASQRGRILHSLVRLFRLGLAQIAAESLDRKAMRRAILRIKSLDAVRELAQEAGYQGGELEQVVAFAQAGQARLGQDMDAVWTLLTGETGGFAELDAPETGGARKPLLHRHRRLTEAERTLLAERSQAPGAQEVPGRSYRLIETAITLPAYRLVRVEPRQDDPLAEFLYLHGGSYEYTDPASGRSTVFVLAGLEDEAVAVEHEEFELYWNRRLAGEPEAATPTRQPGQSMPVICMALPALFTHTSCAKDRFSLLMAGNLLNNSLCCGPLSRLLTGTEAAYIISYFSRQSLQSGVFRARPLYKRAGGINSKTN